ncbi:LuxR C-terminal-related transcriptional regulator [Bacillus salipaludis]|uniref:LuxR C-terminal-related transcriptional regulator n=1 Tax=Bacillus salipaludis TaxID=2547811 RepID=A0AA90ZAI9_9BACI|nr:LuxR C-terminal-related transcriptional regulator [Bacillus salipaludis]MDQ6601045.1 LuxR C-terminal-related transcriptional regulator [Bacillus salipaludis]
MINGKPTKEVANLLFISEGSVRKHVSKVFKKLNVKERMHTFYELIRLGKFPL